MISKSENPQNSYPSIFSLNISPYAGFRSHNFLIFRGIFVPIKRLISSNKLLKSFLTKEILSG